MTAAATVLFLVICINIILWLVFLHRFRKIFSTDEILTRTQTHLNNMLKDINSNASRNLDLLEEKIRQVKSVAAETERKIEELKAGLKKTEDIKAFENNLSTASRKSRSENKSSVTSRYKKSARQEELFTIQEEETADSKETKENIPQITYAKEQIYPVKDFATQVMEYKQKGYQPEAIAKELGRSLQEVRLVLELEL
ncbi:hypothetical protein [Treponema sp.]|uniref:hypothetical protein n=1 Tax=Treponema sp. TaxID=166 RepID=UPI0025E7C957|nr:hypothetical protein [Treponema sp.]MCR5217232.1 hypothetical protein [Treponema sp.]